MLGVDVRSPARNVCVPERVSLFGMARNEVWRVELGAGGAGRELRQQASTAVVVSVLLVFCFVDGLFCFVLFCSGAWFVCVGGLVRLVGWLRCLGSSALSVANELLVYMYPAATAAGAVGYGLVFSFIWTFLFWYVVCFLSSLVRDCQNTTNDIRSGFPVHCDGLYVFLCGVTLMTRADSSVEAWRHLDRESLKGYWPCRLSSTTRPDP